MAWPTLVQGTGDRFNAGTTSASKTFASNTTSGNVIIVGVTAYLASNTSSITVTDSKSNTYILVAMQVNGDMVTAIFLANNITGGSSHSVTATFGTGSYVGLAIGEFSGASNVMATGFVVGQGTSTTPATSNGDINATTDLIVGVMIDFTFTTTITLGSGFSAIFSQAGDATHCPISCEYQTGLGSDTAAGWTLGSSQKYSACAAVFYPVPAAGGGLLRNPGMNAGLNG